MDTAVVARAPRRSVMVPPAVVPSTFCRVLQSAAAAHLPGPVRELHPHLLRHACATHNYEAGTVRLVERSPGERHKCPPGDLIMEAGINGAVARKPWREA
jgi:hypothetical protein